MKRLVKAGCFIQSKVLGICSNINGVERLALTEESNKLQIKFKFNPLKPELNPICYLLALLGAHHFLHVSRIRVKLLTLR